MMQQIYPVTEHPYAYELNKDFQFAAAHYVPHEDAGKCQNMHGHTYFTNVTIAGDELDHTGFLVDFKKIKDLIHKRFDHRMMNEDTKFSDQDAEYFPTTEVVARTIYEIIKEYLNTLSNNPTCVQVYLRETPTSYCIYRPKEKTL
ncbi:MULTISPECIES: 6-carboxytetrahydropterin synthase QueD [Oceanobacillus]|uniref:6-carboxy-5,6,7,8-tetrahydropterin synthase n=1 Tax=Oceanobacillus profundus TaxID=372463 RepID=A0A417YLK6_9BACI|nr:6-carboxytetrahydropterin synthase QueD [Oceanobacillus profundus]MBQ6445993.1 6-carboxytetrahydropterin synthase QueD [Bacillus sp. (in: firmicutes)]MBR3118692.1 6-carboxytetrahydropterin synthase QueD [Oceanobacillus sp.]PAE29300.1 6-carboxytetrahydropterin synthase QueD [Paenibacillus sp. 7884-2]MCM3399379.1 6-carboxytetrahydropterin synthase QueD [Oceanobacillus profundus]RHW34340.1 6-carboxytetrahydropterin synthase QueD [Oceanobacillus profundus]